MKGYMCKVHKKMYQEKKVNNNNNNNSKMLVNSAK